TQLHNGDRIVMALDAFGTVHEQGEVGGGTPPANNNVTAQAQSVALSVNAVSLDVTSLDTLANVSYTVTSIANVAPFIFDFLLDHGGGNIEPLGIMVPVDFTPGTHAAPAQSIRAALDGKIRDGDRVVASVNPASTDGVDLTAATASSSAVVVFVTA